MYLDHNATAPYSPSVVEYVRTGFLDDYANPSSEHDAGFKLSLKMKDDRAVIAEFLDCSTGELFFTSGATESISTILSQSFLKKNNVTTIITSKLEHAATLDNCRILSRSGFDIEFVDNDENGVYDVSSFTSLCQKRPRSLISLLLVNNETGVINDLKELTQIAHSYGCKVHVDAVQALGKLDHSLFNLGIDYASYSGHKIGSLKGIGVLFAKDPDTLVPLVKGGGQERGYRAGTYNYSAIHSLALAIDDLKRVDYAILLKARDRFENNLTTRIPQTRINCSSVKRIPTTSNIYLGGFEAKKALLLLSQKGIYISTGSACSAGTPKPSHVIEGLGHDLEYASSCIRVSSGLIQTYDYEDEFISHLSDILKTV